MFQFMENMQFDNYESFKERIDNARSRMLSKDYSLLSDRQIDIDIDSVAGISNGRFNIEYNDILFECFFYYKSKSRLYVFLNGALTDEPPQFKRWSYYSFLDGSILNIADPMYRLYDNLALGWYYGNKDCDFRIYITEIVKKIAQILCISDENIIFFGSSGGGAAAIECAALLNEAKGVSINPQIVLEEYTYAKEFSRITGVDLKNDDKWHRNDALYWLNTNTKSSHILIFNLRSRLDMEQVENICRMLNITVCYGLNVFKDLVIWIYDAECLPYVSGHSAQEFYCIMFVIEYMIKNIDLVKNKSTDEDFFRLINELWYNHWQQEKKIKQGKIDIQKLIFCRETKKKIALWGSGNWASTLSEELFDILNDNPYKIQLVIDNDEKRDGGLFKGKIEIKHPNRINNWNDYYVIITMIGGCEQVMKQLEEKNMSYKQDFIFWRDLFEK